MSKVDILAFGAHPDDTELSCAGTLASLIKQGLKVAVVDLTEGEMGSRGTRELRRKEAKNAAEILGLQCRENLCLPDTELLNTREFQLPIIRKVREYQPHICILPAPIDRHPDHGNASQLLTDAIFYSGLVKIETKNDQRKIQKPHRPSHVLHYMQNYSFEPDFVFDITDTIDLKEKAIKAFSSQFHIKEPGDEPETYISGMDFFEGLRAKARHYGHLSGFTYGEPFLYAQKPFSLTNIDFLMGTSPKR